MGDTSQRRSYQPQAVRKALAILDCFDRNRTELSVADLCSLLGMGPSTLYRYLEVLEEAQYVTRVPGKPRYALGLGLIELGGLALSRLEVRRHGQGELDQLAATVGLNANLAVLHRGDVMHLAYSVRTDVDRMYSTIGRRTPAHCTALGKALLAYQEPQAVRRTIDRFGWRPLTRNSITSFDALFAELRLVRQSGYAVDSGAVHENTMCVAAPVRTHGGTVVAAISVSGPAADFSDDALPRMISEVCHRAESLSLRLGYADRVPPPTLTFHPNTSTSD